MGGGGGPLTQSKVSPLFTLESFHKQKKKPALITFNEIKIYVNETFNGYY